MQELVKINPSEQIKRFQEFLESYYYHQIIENLSKDKKFVVVDFADLSKFDIDLANELLENPEDTIKVIELAAEQFDLEDIKGFKVRFKNLSESQYLMIRNIRSKHINRFMYVEGIVRQKSDVRPQVTAAKFECPVCGNIINVLQLNGSFKEPSKCGCGRKGKFIMISKELVDAQGIILEEVPESLEGGEQPKRINIFLKDDLVSPLSERKTNPGSKISIVGIIKEVPIISKTGSTSTRFELMVEANYVEAVEETFYEVEITEEEEQKIIDFSQDPELHSKLINSTAPSIFGYEKVKEALLLQLFGGVRKVRTDKVVSRGDMHVLLVGDPGSGKSAMLKRISAIAPKGRYVAGRGVSGAGLTASVVKDEFLKGWSLEAGALVLASNGICCVHPGTEIVVNNKIQNISDMFNEHKKIIGKCKHEIIELNNIKKNIVSFDLNKLHTGENSSTVIRRKKHNGNLINIKFKSGFSIKLTPDHKIIDGKNLQWKKTEQFKIGEKVLAPLKLPNNKKEIFVFDILPGEWKVFLNKDEKKQIKEEVKKRFKKLKIFNEKLGLDKTFLSGTKQVTIEKFSEIANFFGEENDWKNTTLKFGRNKNGEKLKISKITPELGYLMGFIYGDGHVKIDDRRTNITITQSVKHKDYIKRFKDCWHKVALRKLNEYESERTSIIRGKRVISKCKVLYCGSNIIGNLYSYYVGHSLKNILCLPDDVLKSFIAGVIDSDGCISKRKSIKNGKRYFTQIIEILFSNKLEDNLNFLLALRRIDCYGKVYNKAKNIKSIVVSSREDITNIVNELKPFSVKIGKVDLLTKIKQIPGDSDKIPSLISKKICERISSLNKSFLVKKGIWSAIYDLKNLKREPSRSQIRRIIQKTRKEIDDPGFMDFSLNLIKRDYFLDEIISIKREKYNGYVYDLYVPKNHNFLANGIIVHNCIDEMDKMVPEDRAAMHEALEQQTVSISKANIQATLISRTTVLAAANPKFGRFDPYGIIAEQIDLPPTLINRFDLIFPIKDLPDETKDEKMASHILKLHQDPDLYEPELSTDFLKKYIAYAKQKVSPIITDEALQEIKDFYLKMRGSGGTDEGVKAIPISARQLEGLVRLSEASARLRLSDKATRQDARRAIELVNFCLMEVGLDRETGKIDIDRIATGISASQRSHISQVKEIINDLENKLGKTIPIDDIIEESKNKGIAEEKVEEVLEKLKRVGEVFEPRRGFLSKI